VRKILSLLLVPLLLIGLAAPALGAGYKEKALEYLNAKYGGQDIKIELYEGGITELEYTGEKFWFGKYIVVKPGAKPPVGGASGRAAPSDKPAVKPEPARPEIMPLPSPDIYYNDNNHYGGLYIRIKTGEILELEQMEPYFSAENTLAQQEWERLSKEAGKLDVSLYRKLQKIASSETVNVSFQPTVVITAEIVSHFNALKTKYPKVFTEVKINLEDLLGVGQVSAGYSRMPLIAVSMTPAPRTDAAPPVEKPGAEIRQDDEYWKQQSAFWSEIEQLRVLATAGSMESIKADLETMGVSYTAQGTAVVAELTAMQVNEVAKLAAVAAVYEHIEITAMSEGAEIRLTTAKAADMNAPPTQSSNSISPFVAVVTLFGGVVVLWHRGRVGRMSRRDGGVGHCQEKGLSD